MLQKAAQAAALLVLLAGCAPMGDLSVRPNVELTWRPAEWHQPVRLTRSAGGEFQPDYCSRTGALAYVSEREGSADIYLREEAAEPLSPARRLAAHGARDLWPRLSPDGERVAFVSTRADSGGDLWLLRPGGWFRPRAPERLTDGRSADDQPCWHPNGKTLFYAAAPSPGGPYRLRRLDLGGEPVALNGQDGQMPDCSPDGRFLAFVRRQDAGGTALHVLRLADGRTAQLTGGPQMDLHPCWAADGSRVLFTRHPLDTNRDGRLDQVDASSVYSVRFSEGMFQDGVPLPAARQLTSLATAESHPRAGGAGFVFTRASGTGGADLFMLPASGEMPELATVPDYVRFARRADQQALGAHRRALAWQNAVWAASESARVDRPDMAGAGAQEVAAAWLALGRVHEELGYSAQARQALRRAVETAPSPTPVEGEARLALLALEFEQPGQGRLEAARALEEDFRAGRSDLDLRRIAALARVERGRARLAAAEYQQALSVFESVATEYPEQLAARAEALLGGARVYELVGEPDAARRTYLTVLRRFGQIEQAAQEAAARSVRTVLRGGADFDRQLSELRPMVEQHGEVPLLAARAQNALGDLFYERRDFARAATEYQRTIEQFPEQRRQSAAAYLALARIRTDQKDYEEAVRLLDEMEQSYSGRGGALRRKAHQGLVRSLLLSAQRAKELGDWPLALDTYKTLAETERDSAAARHGMVECYYQLGRTEEAILRYRERLEAGSGDHLARYALALAYSYHGPTDWVGSSALTGRRVRIDREALSVLEEAIRAAPDVPYYHQLRGFLHNRLAVAEESEDDRLAALDAYLAALGLSDPETDPANYANALLNVGEGYALVERPAAAYPYYRRALGAGFRIEGQQGRTALRNVSRAAMAAGRYDHAAELLDKALGLLPDSEVDVQALRERAELLDRLALAHHMDGDYRAAADAYRRYADRVEQLTEADPRSAGAYRRNLLRGSRNLAVNLYLAAERGGAGEEALKRAYSLLQEALERLKAVGIVRVEQEAGGGLINISVDVALGERTGPAAFDAEAERRLLFTYAARICALAGDYAAAADYLQRKLALYPELAEDTERVDLLTEQGIVRSQAAGYLVAEGNLDAAAQHLGEAVRLEALAGNLEGRAAAVVSLGRVVQRMAGADAELLRTTIAMHREALDRIRADGSERLAPAEASLATGLAALTELMEAGDA
ncbi:MAG: tetratricopeptide repeat protein [Candidatus Brocadiia bacterium]